MFRHTHKYAYLNLVILAMICVIYFLSTNDDALSVMAGASANPKYRAACGEQIAFVSWYDGDAAALEACAQAADENNIKLNVFLKSSWLFENKDNLTYTLQQGHVCGIYGADFSREASAEEITANISGSLADFQQYAGDTRFFMPSHGEYTKRLTSCANKLSLQVILWSKDTRAYTFNEAGEFAEQVVSNAEKGDFILIRLDDRMQQALPGIGSGLVQNGLSSVHLRDLLND